MADPRYTDFMNNKENRVPGGKDSPAFDTVAENDLEKIRKVFEKAGETELFEKYAGDWEGMLDRKNQWRARKNEEGKGDADGDRRVWEAAEPEDLVSPAKKAEGQLEKASTFSSAVNPAKVLREVDRPWPYSDNVPRSQFDAQHAASGKAISKLRSAEDFLEKPLGRQMWKSEATRGARGVEELVSKSGHKMPFEPESNYSKAARAAMSKHGIKEDDE